MCSPKGLQTCHTNMGTRIWSLEPMWKGGYGGTCSYYLCWAFQRLCLRKLWPSEQLLREAKRDTHWEQETPLVAKFRDNEWPFGECAKGRHGGGGTRESKMDPPMLLSPGTLFMWVSVGITHFTSACQAKLTYFGFRRTSEFSRKFSELL